MVSNHYDLENTISQQNLLCHSLCADCIGDATATFITCEQNIIMTAITTNIGAGVIMEKKLRHNCFAHFFMLLNKGFGEWDGPVAEELSWMEKHQSNCTLQNVYSLFFFSFFFISFFVYDRIFWKTLKFFHVCYRVVSFFAACIWTRESSCNILVGK